MVDSAPGSKARVLVVAGSDSSAGAGVDADRDALSSLGVNADYVVTAWTVQNEAGVRDLGRVDPKLWGAEAKAYCQPGLAAVKFGLLPGVEALRGAAELLAEVDADVWQVLDPVLGSSSGTRFHDSESLEVMRELLMPMGLVWTPNLPELAELSGTSLEPMLESVEARRAAARKLLHWGARAVVVKGGHGQEDPVVDLLLSADGENFSSERPRLVGSSIRGSGCRFASALAAHLAIGQPLSLAIRAAGSFVESRLLQVPKKSS